MCPLSLPRLVGSGSVFSSSARSSVPTLACPRSLCPPATPLPPCSSGPSVRIKKTVLEGGLEVCLLSDLMPCSLCVRTPSAPRCSHRNHAGSGDRLPHNYFSSPFVCSGPEGLSRAHVLGGCRGGRFNRRVSGVASGDVGPLPFSQRTVILIHWGHLETQIREKQHWNEPVCFWGCRGQGARSTVWGLCAACCCIQFARLENALHPDPSCF